MDSKITFRQNDGSEWTEGSSMQPTPVNTHLPVKSSGFVNLVEALDYAAHGVSGFNFYDHRGELEYVLSYRELRDEAKALARRLLGLGLERGDRVGILAETDPMFHRFFFACQYAGLIPVALPAGVQLGAHKAYVNQIRRMLESCGAGSTRFPRGVEINQETLLENLRVIAEDGMKLTSEDRLVSWLPYYHDMGLIGFILGPLV